MKGIPTVYKERNMRSRLEARWAAMFDLLSWDWEYEPFDLEGWIPDFVIYGAKEEIIVEVKPYSRLDQYDIEKIKKGIRGTEKEGTDILLVGSRLIAQDIWNPPCPSIGFLGDGSWCEEYDFEPAVWLRSTMDNSDEKIGFFHPTGRYADRITGAYSGDHHIGRVEEWEICSYWAEAGNVTQWKKDKAYVATT